MIGRRLILFLVGLLVATVGCGGCTHPEPVTFRVLTYNIHHGEGMDGKMDLERIAGVIRRSKANLVALQEVDRDVPRSHHVDQPTKLAALTDMHVVFGKSIDLQGGEYGNAVLSRYPIESHQNHLLPRNPGNEQRGLLEVHLLIGDQKFVFFATHLDHKADDRERMASVAVLRELIDGSEGASVIVAGDFNATPDSRVIRQARSFLRDTSVDAGNESPSFPADVPERRIDYILYGMHRSMRSTMCHVIPEAAASDHRPVVAVLEFDRKR